MKVGNFFWFILAGMWQGILYFLSGVLCCITIVGIPFGLAYFRIAKATFFPFGKEVTTDFDSHPTGNILWLIFGGAELAVSYAIGGVLLCITIIGIPFAKQYFKLMKLTAIPFGADMV